MKRSVVLLGAFALVLAITTGAFAASTWTITTSSQIKPGSIGYGNLSSAAKKRLAGAKGSTGATGAPGATGATGPAGAAGTPGASGLSLFVRADQTGAIHQHTTGATVVKSGVYTGLYKVTFTQDISNCAVVVSQGEGSSNGFFAGVQFVAKIDSDPGSGGDVHSVDVYPTLTNGTATDAGFDLIVAC